MTPRGAAPVPPSRIVIVDDDPATLEVFAMALRFDGHEVVCASNGVDGLARVRETRPDLVIVDWMMPGLDGLSMTEQLRQEQRLSRLPILMVTAKAMHGDAEIGLQAGVDAYYTKPLDLNLLRDEVHRLCSHEGRQQHHGPMPAPPSVPGSSRSEWAVAVSAAMAERELTLLDVSVAGKVSPATLARVLAGDTWPRTDTVLAMSAFLDIDPPDHP